MKLPTTGITLLLLISRQLILLATVLLLPSLGSAQDRLATLAGEGGVLLHSPDGEVLVSYNPDKILVPASLIKIPLAHTALAVLGEDFRFETHFYTNDAGDLLIRGLGDPFLVSEEIAYIAERLSLHGLTRVRRLVMDDSAFEANLDLPVEEQTDQPYGARNSALAVNFNTVNLAWNGEGRLISAEAQTPLTPLAREFGNGLTPGSEQRINLGRDPRSGLTQAQQLFRIVLEEHDIAVEDPSFHRESVGEGWSMLYQHSSRRSLRDNLDGLLRYSNNFIANQIFLTLGAQSGAYPVSTEQARSVLQEQLTQLYGDGYGRDPHLLHMVEGSGLSRLQRTSASGFMGIVEKFKPYAELLPEVNGVLRKSGTLTGVYNFAGFIRGDDGLYPFVILSNQRANNRAEILTLLQRRI